MAALARAAAPLAGLAVGLALLGATRGLDDIAREGQLGPGFWPRLVLFGLVAVCAVRAVGAWRDGAAVEAGPARAPARLARLTAAIGLLLLYVVGTPLIGFPLATAGFIAAFMSVAGARSGAGTALAAVAGTVGLLYLFIKVVYLPLPKGAGPFETLTLGLYRALGIF